MNYNYNSNIKHHKDMKGIYLEGKYYCRKFALYYNDDVMNMCDSRNEIKIDWLSTVYDEYIDLVKQYSLDEKNTSQSCAKIREDERKLLEQARNSVKICQILY
jgi:hypothetical protein